VGALARSGLLYGRRAETGGDRRGLGTLLASPALYINLQTTAGEVATALVIGGAAGLLVRLVLGGSRFLRRALNPTSTTWGLRPNHLLPDHDHVVRHGAG
jgi:hypothetical protein